MKKKQFGISFLYSFLTHALLLAIVLFAVYYVKKEWVVDEMGGGRDGVWIDISSMDSGIADIANRKNSENSLDKNKEIQKKIIEKKTVNPDAMNLRQKEKINSPENQNSNKPAEASVPKESNGGMGSASETGGGAGLGKGSGRGEGSGLANSPSILGLIRRKIEQAKRYPVLARARKIEGVSVLSFSITSGGGVEKLRLVNSSGSELLDEEALATVKRAAPLPYYSLPIQISIKFSLE